MAKKKKRQKFDPELPADMQFSNAIYSWMKKGAENFRVMRRHAENNEKTGEWVKGWNVLVIFNYKGKDKYVGFFTENHRHALSLARHCRDRIRKIVELIADDKAIAKAQKKAKKIGHCLCNLKTKCPCEEYKLDKKCKCSKLFKEKNG